MASIRTLVVLVLVFFCATLSFNQNSRRVVLADEVVEEIEEVVMVEKVSVEIPEATATQEEEKPASTQEAQQPHEHGPTIVNQLLAKGHDFADCAKTRLHSAFETLHEIFSLPRRLLERRDKFEHLLGVIRAQNPVLLLILCLLPFVAFAVLLPDKQPQKHFAEKVSLEEYQKQTTDYTAQQLQQLQQFIKENPAVVETTKYYKESLISGGDVTTTTTTTTVIETTTVEAR